MIIQVFFYDQLGDETVVRTNANVSSHWSTLPADWQADDMEILEVDYTQAKPEPGKIEEGRHYYGYVVCVYYKQDLQDMAADPQALLKKFPPPLSLPCQGRTRPMKILIVDHAGRFAPRTSISWSRPPATISAPRHPAERPSRPASNGAESIC